MAENTTMDLKKLTVLRKTSLIDYPGRISAVIFFPGCNLRCPWCHNRELVLFPETNRHTDSGGGGSKADAGYITLEKALAHVEKRRKLLGGVVLSGGEPTLFPGIGELIEKIKSFKLPVKIDTNGLLPDVLETLFSGEQTRPSYIAMDLKTSPRRYADFLPKTSPAGADPGTAITRSAALIRASGIPHEFRSLAFTENHAYFEERDRAALAPLAGDSPWHIRPFVPGNCLDPSWNTGTAQEEQAALSV